VAAPVVIPALARSAMAGGIRPIPPPRVLPPPPRPERAVSRAHRVTMSVDLRMFIGERELAMQSRDVSGSGLFAVTREELPLGAVFECELSLPGPGMSEESYRARLRVVRRSSIGYGCELVEPSPDLVAALARLAPGVE
jgi:hypothetical protein